MKLSMLYIINYIKLFSTIILNFAIILKLTTIPHIIKFSFFKKLKKIV